MFQSKVSPNFLIMFYFNDFKDWGKFIKWIKHEKRKLPPDIILGRAATLEI